MLVLISCVSKPQAVKTVVVYQAPEIPKPVFPDPYCVIPYTEDGRVVENEEQVWNEVRMPAWYWNEIVKYKSDVDVLYNSIHPP